MCLDWCVTPRTAKCAAACPPKCWSKNQGGLHVFSPCKGVESSAWDPLAWKTHGEGVGAVEHLTCKRVGGSWLKITTSNRHQCWSDYLTRKGECWTSSTPPLSNVLRTKPTSLKNSSKKEVLPSARPSDKNKNTEAHNEMRETPHSEEDTKCSKLNPNLRASLTVKEGTWASEHLILPCWHSEHSDREEPSDSELSQHASLIS